MDRRRNLLLAGLGVLSSISGCLAISNRALTPPPEIPSGMTVETASWSRGFVTEDGRDGTYADVVTSREEADDNIPYRETRDDIDPREFVAQTDFERSYLILVGGAYASGTDVFELRRIERRDHGLHVKARLYSPGNGSNDVTGHSLFIRVTDERAGPPQDVTVVVEDDAD